jgi:hypothetical protein
LQLHAPDPHSYGLMLLRPSPRHVSALCVQLPDLCGEPPGRGAGPVVSTGLGSGLNPAGTAAGWSVRMWECVPLVGEREMGNGQAAVLAVGGG